MEKEKVEKTEEKVEKNSKNVVWLTIVIIVLLVAAALGGYLVGASRIANEVVEQKENASEEQVLKVTNEVKDKIERFVEIGSYFDYSGNNTMEFFTKGTTDISKDIKLKMTRNAIYKDGSLKKDVVLSSEEASKLEGVKPENGEIVDTISKADFDKTYKGLFNEDAKYEFEELKNIGCPAPMAINKSTEVYYLYHRCGGTGMISYEGKVVSIDSDKDYYYANQEIIETNGQTNETKTINTVWKFDKDLNFVSTTNK